MLTGKHSVLSTIIYPFDHNSGYPRISESGKYVFRMNFNGCWRRVVVDDRLPASKTNRTLFVVDRRNTRLIWPALLEKAYLKVRGGYDFPGSNSGTDLWVLTGWIPEQLFLQREDFDLSTTWRRIKAAHETQDVVVTLGTGRISAEEEEVMGLVGEHDYAVLDMDCSDGIRKLLIKNPWCNGPVWTGAGWSTPQQSPRAGMSLDGETAGQEPELYPSGTLWVAFEDVAQHFESMYLNWNPKLFPHRQDRHFSWSTPPKYLAASLVRNVQYSISCPRGGLVWMLVSRHFVDQELVIMRNRRDSMAAVAEQLGYMSILIFETNGKRVQTSEGHLYRGPYVDSPQTLARLETEPGKQYTIVLDQQELPLESYRFTLTVFSEFPVEVREAQEEMSHSKEMIEERMRAPIQVSWLTRGSVCVRNVSPKGSRDEVVRQSSSPMIRVYIVHGWGPQQLVIAESGDGEFVESTAALRTPEFDLEPERTHSGQMWLVVETIGVPNALASLEMDVFSDSPVQVGPWQSW
ncbi:PALB protein [Cordyceps fumosorosea ARSEF 2679]|uniref:PALB protein n=1 Tax=Cordyceps fumosorosea (strain ARSEF 2679) TaxID=1081104 RepID=A0A167MJ17_CORFA|nr:PALB protein [Cordyceps fumosorosea ARSEF 2679]OAA54414.1 PALB protein [Cordyceps fumosorosea ARSEF 2679]